MLHPAKALAPARAVRLVRRELVRLARPAGSFDARRYFRDAAGLGFYNIGAPRLRELAGAVVRANRAWTVDDAMAFAEALIGDRHLEAKGVGIEVVARFRRAFTPPLLGRWKAWLVRNDSANWATTDAICGSLIGPLLVAYPGLVPRVARWSGSRNIWVRRASAVALIPSVRQGAALDEAYAVATRLESDREDLIQKAVGWMLRESGKADPARLERYLRSNGPLLARTTVRYAIERFPPEKRRILLEATRPRGKETGPGRR